MKLIVGLGNPGDEYANTRHNAGYMVVERLARRHQLTGPKSRFHSRILQDTVNDDRCLLMQPVTYMNHSGRAVTEAVHYYRLNPAEELLIVVDDAALPCGRLRLRQAGSSGGHNGLIDVERALATTDYPRLRIGIDPPGTIPQVDYVLGRFTADQKEILEPALDTACDAIECWISNGINQAMNQFNATA